MKMDATRDNGSMRAPPLTGPVRTIGRSAPSDEDRSSMDREEHVPQRNCGEVKTGHHFIRNHPSIDLYPCHLRYMHVDLQEDVCGPRPKLVGDHISQLPAELLVQLLSHLPIPDLKRAERLSKHFRGTIKNPDNVNAFLQQRQYAARARLSRKIGHLTRRGFLDQQDGDLLDTFCAFVNRGGLTNDVSRCHYILAAMMDLFELNLRDLPSQIMEHTNKAELLSSLAAFVHFLFIAHIIKHVPCSELSCGICARWSIDGFMQGVASHCSRLERFGFTQDRALGWYQKLWNPMVPCGDDWADGILQAGPPLLNIVPEVEGPPRHLITHLWWHQGPNSANRWSATNLPVHRGLCSMAQLAAVVDVPSLPAKTNPRNNWGWGSMPLSHGLQTVYFFAYYMKSAWAYGLVQKALNGEGVDAFVLTAILEELNIY
ncbi:hypothetical protein DOTSEDRAFT_70764 [Dothistroma septosporum NZE10]|uniref:F-box domain-containing protein n=1 Tax=Dothistroma septosporum (strain NZE10 / CBS 128990) TaxID=675120 RepID=N1PTZ8_DOTSN|nr:hypothetical protein DOTSEDRAFT_70764 [Dothistroma septosporum NZE10]